MKQMWTPWRMEYLEEHITDECIFCTKPRENRDEENLILHRGQQCFVILNRYPYSNGHLMVVPYRHIGTLEELTEAEQIELMSLITKSIRALRTIMSPQGFNVGFNIGKAAGAGFDAHIHAHIVPRWVGDTNFMPVLADCRCIPESLQRTYEKLKAVWTTA